MSYIAIVDYGAGNLMSVHNTLDYLGYENKIAASADVIENAAGVILPGVGAFPDAMAALEHSGLTEAVLKAAKEKPFLGICLGMQMLFEESDEVRPCKGLGLLPGRIERIETALKLPQIGWNALDILRPNAMTEGLENGSYVYFVHSFMAHPADENDLAAVTDYGTRVPAMVARGNLFGCQFHPEKSGEAGLRMQREAVARDLRVHCRELQNLLVDLAHDAIGKVVGLVICSVGAAVVKAKQLGHALAHAGYAKHRAEAVAADEALLGEERGLEEVRLLDKELNAGVHVLEKRARGRREDVVHEVVYA